MLKDNINAVFDPPKQTGNELLSKGLMNYKIYLSDYGQAGENNGMFYQLMKEVVRPLNSLVMAI